MALVDVFDDRDLELARQQDDRQHRQHRQRRPGGVVAGGAALHQQRVELGHRGGFGKHIGEAVEHAVSHEHADGNKGDQFDDGLKGDDCDQTLVAFGGVEVAGAKQDGECRQQHRNVEGVVLEKGQRGGGGHGIRVLQHGRKTRRDRFQLQCDIGHDAEHGDDGDQTAQHMAFAVTRSDEVGDGGDAVCLADADHFQQHVPPQCGHQRRSEIDRQKADAAGRGAADTAVERPRRAVHRQRQRVDVRIGDEAASGIGAFVAVIGDGEQQADVGEGEDNDQRAGEHGRYGSLRSMISAIRAMIAIHAANT